MAGLRAFVAIVGVFLLLGPPLGSLTFSLVGAAGALITRQPPGTAGMMFYGGLLSFVLSWLVGGIQAAVAGAITAAYALRTGRFSWLLAIVSGLVPALVYVYREDLAGAFGLLILTVHVVPAVICTGIAKAMWGGGRASGRLTVPRS